MAGDALLHHTLRGEALGLSLLNVFTHEGCLFGVEAATRTSERGQPKKQRENAPDRHVDHLLGVLP